MPWLADALVKILIPIGARAAEQWCEQIVMAENRPAGIAIYMGTWQVTRPASRPALAASAGWAHVIRVAGEGLTAGTAIGADRLPGRGAAVHGAGRSAQ